MRVLIACLGSLGDTLPFVAIGKALQARGHEVFLFANEVFRPFAAGLPLAGRQRLRRCSSSRKSPIIATGGRWSPNRSCGRCHRDIRR
jgi:rhamnosyltransferase subunit B